MRVVPLNRTEYRVAFAIMIHLSGRTHFIGAINLEVGPFASERQAQAWEHAFTAAVSVKWHEGTGQSEGRTLRGRAVKETTGKQQIETSIVPGNESPLTPKVKIQLSGSDVISGESFLSERPHVNSAISADEVAINLDYYVREAIRKALDE